MFSSTLGSMPPSTGQDAVVHIVDDDEDLRRSLVFLLNNVDVQALVYPNATSFLDEFDPDEPAVLIVDVRMPGPTGFQLQEELARRDYPAPIIFCSAHGDIPMSVRALRKGAVDFLEKPYEPQRMLELVQAQLVEAAAVFTRRAQRRSITERLSTLTPRERDVLRLVIDGLPSQVIAHRLGTSVKTIDVHRSRIKTKTGAETLGTLVRNVLRHQIAL